jgi:hypothetical protein
MPSPPQPRFAVGDLVRVSAPEGALSRWLIRVFRSPHRPVGKVMLVRQIAWAPAIRRLVYEAQGSDGRRLWLYEHELEPGAPGPLVPVAV